MQVYVDGGYKTAMLNEVLSRNLTYNIAGTYDGSNVKLYINGIEMASTAATGTIKDPEKNTVAAIGTNPSGSSAGGEFGNMQLMTARIYSNALSQSSLQALMKLDAVGKTNFGPDNVKLAFFFSEPVKGFEAADITVTNGTKGTFTKVSETSYTLEVTNIVGSENLEVSVAAGSYTDLAGNAGNADTLSSYRDISGPHPTITADKTSPTNSSSVTYTITFHEAVVGFSAADITVTNGTKGTFTKVNGKNYTLVVTNTGSCSQKITVAAGKCYDMVGNSNTAGSMTMTVDRTNPTVTLSPNGKSYTVSVGGKTTISTKLTAADTGGAGLNTLQYAWSTSKSTEPTSWTTFTSGSTVSRANTAKGTYYLWTKVTDKPGNRASSVKVSAAFTVTEVNPSTCSHDWSGRCQTLHNDGVSWTCTAGHTHTSHYCLVCTKCHTRKTTSPTWACPTGTYTTINIGTH